MAVTPKALINSKFAADSQQTEYTVPGSTTAIIDKFTATNNDGGAQTITIHIIPSGGSRGTSNLIIKELSIAAGATDVIDEIANQILETGDIINVVVSLASAVIIRCSGREVV